MSGRKIPRRRASKIFEHIKTSDNLLQRMRWGHRLLDAARDNSHAEHLSEFDGFGGEHTGPGDSIEACRLFLAVAVAVAIAARRRASFRRRRHALVLFGRRALRDRRTTPPPCGVDRHRGR